MISDQAFALMSSHSVFACVCFFVIYRSYINHCFVVWASPVNLRDS